MDNKLLLDRSESVLSVIETHKLQSSPFEKHEVEKDLPKSILQSLLEKNYEKRKQGGHYLQKFIKEQYAIKKSNEIIDKSIRYFHEVYLTSVDDSYRQAGLMAFSAISSAMTSRDDSQYIESLVTPVISCCRDNNMKVKYYAVECLYNIVKVSRKSVLFMFNQFFKTNVDLCIGGDKEVKKAAKKLDSLLKTIVVECEASEELFSSRKFMVLLKEMSSGSGITYVQRMIVSWLNVLDSIPDFNLFTFIPNFLEGVFLMLKSQDLKLNNEAQTFLRDLLIEIKNDIENPNLNLSFIMETLVKVIKVNYSSVKIEAITWISEFIDKADKKMIRHFPMGIKSTLECLSDEDQKINEIASFTNTKLSEFCKLNETESELNEEITHMAEVIIKFIEHESVKTRLAALEWLIIFQQKHPKALESLMDTMINTLSTRLSDPERKVINSTLIILCNIAKYKDNFDKVISSVLYEFSKTKVFNTESVRAKIKILCECLGTELVYKSFAELLFIESDIEFCKRVIEVLNDLLLIDQEFEDIREKMKYCIECDDKECIEFFEILYKAWCINPGCTLILTFLVQRYGLAYEIVNIL